MKRETAPLIGLLSALLLPLGCFAAQAGGAPAASPSTLQKQLQHARAELHQQRAQTEQLRTRVNDLEQRSAANRAQLQRRDREIADLQRKLEALSPPARPAPAAPGSH